MDVLKEYQIVIYGCLVGISFGILIISVGFFKMLLILLLATIGAAIGYYFNKRFKN